MNRKLSACYVGFILLTSIQVRPIFKKKGLKDYNFITSKGQAYSPTRRLIRK